MATAETPYGYSAAHRRLEIAAIFTLFALAAAGTWRVAAQSDDRVLLVGLAVFAGYLMADFISGVVHWMGDRYGTPETPVLGPNFVQPFRHHHVDPEEMTRHDFIETNGNNSVVTVPVMAAAWILPVGPDWGLFAFTALISMTWWVFATNQFHKWSHQRAAPFWVGWLQRARIILEPGHHDVHHTPPYETYYCITSGWLNAPLHRLRFWSRAERAVERLLGIRVTP